MKKAMALGLAMVMFLLALSGCGAKTSVSSAPEAPSSQTVASTPSENDDKNSFEPVKMRIAYHPNMGGASAVVTADKMGYFEEFGIQPEFVKFTSGPPEIAAMVSGDVDVGYIGFGAHTLAIEGQVDVIMLDCLGKADETLTTKDSGITSLEQIKGKTVGTSIGTSGEILLDLALEKCDLTRDDINFVGMDMAVAVSSFVAGQTDIISTHAPYTNEIRSLMGEENVVMLANNLTFMPDYIFPASWVATPDYIEENQDAVVRFIAALLKAVDYRSEHIEEVAQWVCEFNDTPLSAVEAEINSNEWIPAQEIAEAFTDEQAYDWYMKQQEIFIKTEKISQPVDSKDSRHSDQIHQPKGWWLFCCCNAGLRAVPNLGTARKPFLFSWPFYPCSGSHNESIMNGFIASCGLCWSCYQNSIKCAASPVVCIRQNIKLVSAVLCIVSMIGYASPVSDESLSLMLLNPVQNAFIIQRAVGHTKAQSN